MNYVFTIFLTLISLLYFTEEKKFNSDTTVLNEFPKTNQLFTREKDSNLAAIPISGRLEEIDDNTELKLIHSTSNGFSEITKVAIDNNGHFSHLLLIEAELVSHDIELVYTKSGTTKSLAKAENVVAGDAYVIYGQSNALSVPTASFTNEFIRVFGRSNEASHRKWYSTSDESYDQHYIDKPIGLWGQKLAAELIQQTGIPVVIINGSVGGMSILELMHHEDNDALSENYDTLINRVKAANLSKKITGFFWWQGESDGQPWACRDLVDYNYYWDRFYTQIKLDLGRFEKTFLIQPQACMGYGSTPDCMVQIQEAFRINALNDSSIELITTGHLQMLDDLCHFEDAALVQFGNEISKSVLYHLYEIEQDFVEITFKSIELESCGSNKVRIVFDPDQNLEVQNRNFNLFRLEGERPIYSESVEKVGNNMIITFPDSLVPIHQNISHLSAPKSGNSLFTLNGKALPQFYNLAITIPDNDQDGFDCLNDCNDNDSNINPNALDNLINGIDENCDGKDGPEFISQSLIAFPNPPISDYINVFVPGTRQKEISILNNKGKRVFVKNVLPGQHRIDFKPLQKGIYIIRLKTLENGKIESKRVIYR